MSDQLPLIAPPERSHVDLELDEWADAVAAVLATWPAESDDIARLIAAGDALSARCVRMCDGE